MMTMSDQKMTGAEFRDCLDRYGEDVGAWPCAEVAQDFLMESEEARSRLEEMKRLRALFDLASRSAIKAPGGLAARIAAAALADSGSKAAQDDPGRLSGISPVSTKPAAGTAHASPSQPKKRARFA